MVSSLVPFLIVFVAVLDITSASVPINGNGTATPFGQDISEIQWVVRTEPLPMPTYKLNMWSLLLGFSTSYLIGAVDAANAWGTTVGSGVLSWNKAKYLAAFFQICGGMMSRGVSDTIKKVANPESKQSFADGYWRPEWDKEPEKLHGMDLWPTGVVSAQIGANLWQGTVTLLGIPSSNTHAIVGSVVGMSAATNGIEAPDWAKFNRIVIGWFVSPMASALVASILVWSALSFMPIKTRDLRGATYKVCNTVLGFPIFATGFICIMVAVKCKITFQAGGATFAAIGTGLMLTSYLLTKLQGSLPREGQKLFQFDFCCADGKQPVHRAAVFGFVTTWCMLAASCTLLLIKNETVANMVGFDPHLHFDGLSNLFQRSYNWCLFVCLVPATIAGVVVFLSMRKTSHAPEAPDLELSEGPLTRTGKMNPNLAVSMNRNSTWIGALRVQGFDGTWVPMDTLDDDQEEKISFNVLEFLPQVLCRWASPAKDCRSPRVVEYHREGGEHSEGEVLQPKVIFDGKVFGYYQPVARATENSQIEDVARAMDIPTFDQLLPWSPGSVQTSNSIVVIKFIRDDCEGDRNFMRPLLDAVCCSESSRRRTNAVSAWNPPVGEVTPVRPGLNAVCLGEGKEGECWFEFQGRSLGILTKADQQDVVDVLRRNLEQVDCEFRGADFLFKENRKILFPVSDTDDSGDTVLDMHQVEHSRLHAKNLHDSFKWLLVLCACMQSFVLGANHVPCATAAIGAFKDYRDAAIHRKSSVYMGGEEETGLFFADLFTVCLTMGCGVLVSASGLISSVSDIMGPELQGAHLMAYCIEVAAQLAAAIFTCMDVPISMTHCEVGSLCLVSFLVSGRLHRARVCGIVVAVLTAALMSGTLSYGTMVFLKRVQ